MYPCRSEENRTPKADRGALAKMVFRMKTIARIKTPADASAVEGALLKAAYAGHWHDAEVMIDGDEILVSHWDEESAMNQGRTDAASPALGCLSGF